MKLPYREWAKSRGLRLRDPRVLVGILLAYGFARTSGGTLPHLLLYTFAGLTVLSALWVLHVTRLIRVVYETSARRLFRGEDLPVTLLIYNEGFLPAPHLVITDLSHPQRQHTCELSPVASLRLSYQVPQLRRGRYHPGPVAVAIRDPFGFFEGQRSFTSTRPITVYPRVHPWNIQLPLAQSFGRRRTRRPTASDPSGLVGIRDFRTGDNPKHIDWKASARRQQLQLKEFELEATGLVSIYVNLTQADYADEPQLERAIDATAALAVQALHQGFELRIFAQGQHTYYLPPVRGAVGIQGCMELLVDMQLAQGGSLAATLASDLAHAPLEASLVVVTPRMDARAAEVLRRLARRGRSLLLLWVDDATPQPLLLNNLTVYRVDEHLEPHLAWKGGLVHAQNR